MTALVLAGCLAPAPAAQVDPSSTAGAFDGRSAARLEDAPGDAHELGPESVARSLTCPDLCLLPGATSGAAPYFDILGASYLGETEDALRFELEIAQIGEGFPELDGAAAPLHRTAAYRVCFAPAEDAPERCAGADIYTHEGEIVVFGRLTVFDAECNEWGLCEHAIPATLTPGAPAVLAMEVPKALALRDDAPRIASMSAFASWSAYHPVWPWWHAAVTLHDPALGHQHKHVVPADYGETADVLEPAPLELAWTPATRPLAPATGPEIVMAPGNSIGAGSQFDEAQLDLLELDMAEEGGELVVTMRFAEVLEDPGHDVQHILMFGIEGKDVYEVGWLHVGDKSYGYAGHCVSFECAGEHEDGLLAEHDATGHSATETEAEVTPGPLGTIVIRAPFSAFPTLAKGDVTNFLWVVTQHSDAGEWQGSYEAGEHRDVHKMSFIDLRFGGEPHVFEDGNAEPADGHGH